MKKNQKQRLIKEITKPKCVIKKGTLKKWILNDGLYLAWDRVRKTCKNRTDIFNFSLNLNSNIARMKESLLDKRYTPNRYHIFPIFEPKVRIVMSQTVYDKVINHFVALILFRYLEPSLISSNIATRSYKGTDYGRKLTEKYLRKIIINSRNKPIYCLKLDIYKYFYKINHDILLSKLTKRIKDDDLMHLIKIILKCSEEKYINDAIVYYNKQYKINLPYYNYKTGLPIGAMAMQFFAIYYLNDLDHFIKEKLHCKYYIRYQDDFVIFDTDKNKLKRIWKILDEEVNKLKLKFNKKCNIYNMKNGITFLGYKYKVINNKIIKSGTRKTYDNCRKALKKENAVSLKLTEASYYGYYKVLYKNLIKGDYSVKTIDIFKEQKNKNKNKLIIILSGIFYYTFENDSLLLWHIMKYKIKNKETKELSFGKGCLDKVLDNLKEMSIGYIVTDNKSNVLNEYQPDLNVYDSYEKIAEVEYFKFHKMEILTEKLKKICKKNPAYYDKINSYFDEIISNMDK